MSADDEAIATFTATASAVDYFEMHNGTGGVELQQKVHQQTLTLH